MTQNGSKLRKGNLLLNIQVQFRLLLFSSNNTSLVAHFSDELENRLGANPFGYLLVLVSNCDRVKIEQYHMQPATYQFKRLTTYKRCTET